MWCGAGCKSDALPPAGRAFLWLQLNMALAQQPPHPSLLPTAETSLSFWARGHADISDFSPGYTVPYISGYIIRGGKLLGQHAPGCCD